MTDLWSVLLQTLTASGAAALLLAVKALFRDKLSPRWQFGIWGLLALVLLHPAGQGGRYVLLNWPLWLETLKTALTGDYSLIRVVAPIPLPAPLGGPQTPNCHRGESLSRNRYLTTSRKAAAPAAVRV